MRESSLPLTTHLPSGLNRTCVTPAVCPLYVWMHPLRRMSQILRLVSIEPEAKNSPNGWKSTTTQLDRCPVSVRTTAPPPAARSRQRLPSSSPR